MFLLSISLVLKSLDQYIISFVLIKRSSRSNKADCKAVKESSELNSLMKSKNMKLGEPTENGQRRESEEEKEDGEGDKER